MILVVWMCLAILGYVRYLPPAPQSADVASSQFSAYRALPLLESLVGDGEPHPVGSVQNRIVRDRIATHLREFGYEPIIHRTELDDGTVVENVLARLDTATGDSAIALVAHYDSVEEGPGASDDGVGVAAILEVARMLKGRAPSRNDVIFLLTDGEEYGLLGAEAFLNDHPWADDIKVVMNFDARGTSGPSLMFETSDDNSWLIKVLAQSLSRPVTSSAFNEVYQYMPNYTDFSVFRDRGIQGFNFAFIRNVENHHTSRDNLEHVTPGSLQHHGDHAWRLTCALSDMDLDVDSGQAVYTDLFACVVVWWDEVTGRVWAIAMPLLICVVVLILRRRFRIDPWRLVLAFLICPFILALTAASGWLADLIFRRAGCFESHWSPWDLPAIAAYAMVMTGTFAILAAVLLRKADIWTTWISVWGLWSLVGAAVAWVLPGASYLFLLPLTGSVASAAVVGIISREGKVMSSGVLPSLIGAAIAGGIWLPQQIILFDAIGLDIGILFVIGMAALLLTAMPLAALHAESDGARPAPVAEYHSGNQAPIDA